MDEICEAVFWANGFRRECLMDNGLSNTRHSEKVIMTFIDFCEKNSSSASKKKIRDKLYTTYDRTKSIQNICLYMGHTLTEEESKEMDLLIRANLNKSTFRNPVATRTKRDLLKRQNYRCACCDCMIDVHAHADHIIPFKYVGDELEDNFQMLCAECNHRKGARYYRK